MLVVLVLSLGFWYSTRDSLPRVVRIATTHRGAVELVNSCFHRYLIPRALYHEYPPIPKKPSHSEARRYLDPRDEIGPTAAVMESLAATKELLLALAAGLCLIRERWRRLEKKEERARWMDPHQPAPRGPRW